MMLDVIREVIDERQRQDAKWGEQNHPDGTDRALTGAAGIIKQRVDERAKAGTLTWFDILDEEMIEVFSEEDEEKLRGELIQAAAVCVAWAEAIDRRRKMRVQAAA
jgi:hypothetical protein